MISRFLSALSLALAFTVPAAASVVTEADGQFSRHWKSPTLIAPGTATILGTAEKQNAHEFLLLTGLLPGAQMMSFVFDAPDWALFSDSYSAGGQVLFSTSPFRHQWDGTGAGTFQLGRWTPKHAFDLVLGDDFAGDLYLGIYFTHGRDVTWSLSTGVGSKSASDVAVVPLPSAAALAFGGLSMLFVVGRRRGTRQSTH